MYFFVFLVLDELFVDIIVKGIELIVLRVYWFLVFDEDINGIIIGYKFVLFNISGENMRNYILNVFLLLLEIIVLEIWMNYSIRMVVFIVVGEGFWSNFIRGIMDEEGEL